MTQSRIYFLEVLSPNTLQASLPSTVICVLYSSSRLAGFLKYFQSHNTSVRHYPNITYGQTETVRFMLTVFLFKMINFKTTTLLPEDPLNPEP